MPTVLDLEPDAEDVRIAHLCEKIVQVQLFPLLQKLAGLEQKIFAGIQRTRGAATVAELDEKDADFHVQKLDRRVQELARNVHDLQVKEFERKIKELDSKVSELQAHDLDKVVQELHTKVSTLEMVQEATAGVQETMESFIEKELDRPIEASAWEVMVFAGCRWFSWWDTTTIVVASALNLLVQMLFVYVLNGQFLDLGLPDLQHVKNWRLIHAHDARNFVPFSGTSLVSAVCAEDQSLIVSATQSALLHFTRRYTDEAFGPLPIGATLCTLVLFVWFLFLVSELAGSVSLQFCLFNLLGQHTEISLVSNGATDTKLSLRSLSTWRFALCFGATAVRLYVCGVLWYVGSVWLCNTIDLQNLVLNAAALEFLLQIDNMISCNFISLECHAFVDNLEPLRRQRRFLWLGPVCSFIGSSILVTVMVVTHVVENVSLMEEIETTMCGGRQDFIAGEGAFGVLAMFGTQPYHNDPQTFFMDAVREMWETDSTNKASFTFDYTQFSTQVDFASDTGSFVDFFSQTFSPACDDKEEMDSLPDHFLSTLRHQIGLTSISICSEAASLCDRRDLQLLRLMCPVTCGCRDPLSGLYLMQPLSGCPAEACRSSTQYIHVLDSLPCQDMTLTQLNAHAGWTRFWRELLIFKGTTPSKSQEWERVRGLFSSFGCNASSKIGFGERRQLCQSSPLVAAMTSFCPVACSCSATNAVEGCPTACL